LQALYLRSYEMHSPAAVSAFELEGKARATGLLGERQQIRHAKAFKKAKKAVRDAGLLVISVTESQSGCIVQEWVEGVQRLDCVQSPPAVPPPRWQLFLGDCHSFLSSSENWAEVPLHWDGTLSPYLVAPALAPSIASDAPASFGRSTAANSWDYIATGA